ncbi:MAG: hypothetical protein ACLUTZ_13525 [Oliverpabstia sp.]
MHNTAENIDVRFMHRCLLWGRPNTGLYIHISMKETAGGRCESLQCMKEAIHIDLLDSRMSVLNTEERIYEDNEMRKRRTKICWCTIGTGRNLTVLYMTGESYCSGLTGGGSQAQKETQTLSV